jgi:hypothetical protein
MVSGNFETETLTDLVIDGIPDSMNLEDIRTLQLEDNDDDDDDELQPSKLHSQYLTYTIN